jgi:hypothetical protein
MITRKKTSPTTPLADSRDGARRQLTEELAGRGVELAERETAGSLWLEDDGLYQFVVRGGAAEMALAVRPAPSWTPELVLEPNGQISLRLEGVQAQDRNRAPIWELTVRVEVCVRPDLGDRDRALRLHERTVEALSAIGFWLDDEDSTDRAFWECDTGWMMFARSAAEAANCISALRDLRCRHFPDGAPWDHLFSWCPSSEERELLAAAGVDPLPDSGGLACRASALGSGYLPPAGDEGNGHA